MESFFFYAKEKTKDQIYDNYDIRVLADYDIFGIEKSSLKDWV